MSRTCILVTDNDGAYEIHPNAAPEAWGDVVGQRDVSAAVCIEELHGWGRWRWAYRVQRGPETLTYFVSGPDKTDKEE